MADILFTGISTRSISNWLPAFQVLSDRGHKVRSLLFPHLADPDSTGLEKIEFDNLSSIPIDTHLSEIEKSSSISIARQATEIIRDSRPDLLILTTCHAGPESELKNLLESDAQRPVLVGCQHGYVQNWDGYWKKFCADYLFVFGSLFLAKVPEPFRGRVFAASLPKLDLIPFDFRADFDTDHRPILFAAQTVCTPDLINTLVQLSQISNRKIIVRPHPEFRAAFDVLRQYYDFLIISEPIHEQMKRASAVVTTGSTTALEALAAQVPVVVLPEQRGDAYEPAGIVANRMDAVEILKIASQQSQPHRREQLCKFLEAASGSNNNDRASRAADCFEAMIYADKPS